MDGVIYHGNKILPGVPEFIQWLKNEKKEYLFLTNNSGATPRELHQKLERMGLDVPEENFYTSALATAAFVKAQAPGCSAYFCGKPNPLMMRTGLKILGCHSDEAVMIGDRMDTDVISGLESGMSTVLVLSGVTSKEKLQKYAYQPDLVLDGVGDIPKISKSKSESEKTKEENKKTKAE